MSRAAACFRRHALRWRALSTSTDPSSNLLARELPPIPSTDADRKRVERRHHRRMIFVRPWDGIPTMAHTFSIVRDLERRFGRIQEFVVVRDPDVTSSFSPFLHVTFARKEDADAIPVDGQVIQVVVPDVHKERDGGIGLDDLHAYLNPDIREQALLDRETAPEKEPEWGPPEGKVMDVKLERTGLRDPPAVLDQSSSFGRRGPPHLNNPIRIQELAYAIRAFGGFVAQSQGSPTRMEAIVSQWSAKVRQPSQPRPDMAPMPSSPPVAPSPITTSTPVAPSPITTSTPVAPSPITTSTPVAPSPITTSTPVAPSPVTTSTPVAPSPITISTPPPQPKPTLEAVKAKHTPKPIPKPKPGSEPNIPPKEPIMSRKQRMLNAARLAGATAAEKPSNTPEPLDPRPQGTSPVLDAGAEKTSTEPGHDPKASEEENKLAARRWWKFFTGGN